MTKEELKKEAREDVESLNGVDLVSSTMVAIDKYGAYKIGRYDGYLAGAEPREKRIADLEDERSDLDMIAKNYAIKIADLEKENTELKEKLTAIRNAKDKYDMSKDKSIIKAFGAEYTLFCDLERILEDWQEDEQLTKAKEIIRNYYRHYVPVRDDIVDEEADKARAEAFLYSEVEK